MPRRKVNNPRSIILAIRVTPYERQEMSRRAGYTPLGAWIREQALASMDLPPGLTSQTAQPERLPEPTQEGAVPAPFPGETVTDYMRSLDLWSLAALNDRDVRSRLALATAALVRYSSTK